MKDLLNDWCCCHLDFLAKEDLQCGVKASWASQFARKPRPIWSMIRDLRLLIFESRQCRSNTFFVNPFWWATKHLKGIQSPLSVSFRPFDDFVYIQKSEIWSQNSRNFTFRSFWTFRSWRFCAIRRIWSIFRYITRIFCQFLTLSFLRIVRTHFFQDWTWILIFYTHLFTFT